MECAGPPCLLRGRKVVRRKKFLIGLVVTVASGLIAVAVCKMFGLPDGPTTIIGVGASLLGGYVVHGRIG